MCMMHVLRVSAKKAVTQTRTHIAMLDIRTTKRLGHYYLMVRYYNPVKGVFTSRDPDSGDDDDILNRMAIHTPITIQ